MAGTGWIAILVAVLLGQVGDQRLARVSNGVPFINAEYGVSAVFPRGERVCEGLSGDHPHGFYSRLGDPRPECVPGRDPPSASALGIWADYNSAFYRTFDEVFAGMCEADAYDGQPLAIAGLESATCVERGDGLIYIRVSAFAGWWGPPSSDAESDAPYVIYTASLVTSPERLEADTAVFRSFLANLALTPPAP